MPVPQKLPLATASTHVTRLFSMEDLTNLVKRNPNAEEARLQLLRVDPSAETTRRDPTSSTSISSKRQTHNSFILSGFPPFWSLFYLYIILCHF